MLVHSTNTWNNRLRAVPMGVCGGVYLDVDGLPYLLVAQSGRGFERGRGAQAAQGPGLAQLGGLQGASAAHAEAAQVGQVGGRADHAQRLTLCRLHTHKHAHAQPSDQYV
jgi:hypothetical protein